MEGVSVQKQKRREGGRERESKQRLTPFFLEDKNQLFVISPPRKQPILKATSQTTLISFLQANDFNDTENDCLDSKRGGTH